jgi:hypothetical protein
MTAEQPNLGHQGPIPKKGVYFDRVDVDGERHARTYYVDGKAVVYLVAVPDVERPGKWTTGARWCRKNKWATLGWGPLDTEAESLQMMDAVGIGAEAISGGSTFLGFVPEDKPKPAAESNGGPRPTASSLVAQEGWKLGTVLTSTRWNENKTIGAIDEVDGVELVGSASRYWAKSLPVDVAEVKVGV